jgi:hypothetical protein
MKRLLAVFVGALMLMALPVYGQQFPAGPNDDNTSSLGSFKIQVTQQFAPLFNGCPSPPYDPTSRIFTSPLLYDPATKVGRSTAITDGGQPDLNGVAVGTAGTTVAENMLFPPPGFPCQGVANCTSGAGTREIHTEVRELKMADLSGVTNTKVRAGVWYDNPNNKTIPPSRISPGEVESHSGPGGALANDLPASSFFDIFVQVDAPACGGFPGATLYNSSPLLVKNYNLTSLPPRVVYLHDSSTIVPILFLNANPPLWNKDDILGYFVLAGHGIGFTNSQADQDEFNNFMNCQPISTGTSTPSSTTFATHCETPLPTPPPSPSPAPSPTSTPKPVATSSN